MILTRLGNKKNLARIIQSYFPKHNVYIEPFFGAGGMFFNKPKVKYNIVNDLNSDVFNLFQVVLNQKTELKEAFFKMPIHTDLLKYWRQNLETEPIKKAIRFLFLSNFTYLGKMDAIKFGTENPKNKVYKNLEAVFNLLHDVQFMNFDFRKFLKSIQYRKKQINKYFIYCDPPYLLEKKRKDTSYQKIWKKIDLTDLLDLIQGLDCKFAYSEFLSDFIIQEVNKRKLNINIIGDRTNLKNSKTEILITNYSLSQKQLF